MDPDLGITTMPINNQCCGSGMFIPDPTFFHPRSSSKNLSILTKKKAKKWFLSSKKYDPGCSSRIPDRDDDFLPSRIPDLDPQHCQQHCCTGTLVTWEGSMLFTIVQVFFSEKMIFCKISKSLKIQFFCKNFFPFAKLETSAHF